MLFLAKVIPIGRRIAIFGISTALLGAGILQAQTTDTPPKPVSDPIIAKGIQFWRQVDQKDNACTFCHSPDGIELAAYDFSDENIKRRAMPHVGVEGAVAIVDMIHAVRKQYKFKKLLNPMEDRPFQPGGKPLEGKTPIERDRQFAKQLKKPLGTLARGHVRTSADALKARDELIKLDPSNLRIGIPFNRISEDKFHGLEHATIANWFADVPARPIFPWEVAFSVFDRYLAAPRHQDIGSILQLGPNRLYELSSPGNQLGQLKYNALVLFQHQLRMKALGQPTLAGPRALEQVGPKFIQNPMWALGEFSAKYAEVELSSFHLPDSVVQNKTGGATIAEQLREIRPAWLWVGWLLEQDFGRGNAEESKHRSVLLSDTLVADGPYPAHAAYFLARKAALQSETGRTGFDFDSGFLERFDALPVGEREEASRWLGNAARMTLWLLIADVQSGKVKKDAIDLEGVNNTKELLGKIDPAEKVATDAVFEQFRRLTTSL